MSDLPCKIRREGGQSLVILNGDVSVQATAFPCVVGLFVAITAASLPCVDLRRPERVAICIETLYQNTGPSRQTRTPCTLFKSRTKRQVQIPPAQKVGTFKRTIEWSAAWQCELHGARIAAQWRAEPC